MGGRLVPNETAQRIIEGIADEAERETVEEIVMRAQDILCQEAYRLNGSRSLSEDARRRLMNAVGAQYTR